MSQGFRIASYWVYFWTNESDPFEPIHIHVAKGSPTVNATKIWITRAGEAYPYNNNSKIPPKTLRSIMRIIEARSAEIVDLWIFLLWVGVLFLLRACEKNGGLS